MAEDTRNFLERSDSISRKLTGEPTTIDDMVASFAKRDLATRASELDYIENEMSSGAPLSLTEALKLTELNERYNALKNTHEALRKAGR